MQWLRRLFSRHRRYDDLAVSIQEHLDERTDELMEEGLSREEAAQKARREFGNVTQIAERSREAWQWPTLESIWADVKFACLRLRKSPGFSAAVILTLAIGIGANTAVFSVLNSVLLKPLPYPKAEQLVGQFGWTAPGAAGLANFVRWPAAFALDVFHLRRAEPDISVARRVDFRAARTSQESPSRKKSVQRLISDGVLQALDVPPAAGRWLSRVRPESAWRESRDAQLRLLAAALWRRPFRDWPQHHSGLAIAGDRGRDAAQSSAL